MKRHWKFFGVSLLLSAGVLGVSSHAAIASTYRSTSGNTVLVLQETSPLSERNWGYYFTKSAGRSWMGNITITGKDAGAGHTFYTGTFKDQMMGPGSINCTGTIRIRRQNPGVSDRVTANATWQITGGNGCSQIGQTVNLNLVETLPRPDRKGDFTAANANTWMSQTNGEVTWLAWRVVSADGELNCRMSPNGQIKQVFKTRDRIEAETRGANAFVISNGAPWMLTRKGCYVRANTQYIQPISIPF